MIKIFHLNPTPILVGSFENGLLRIGGNDPIKTTKEKVLMRFNRGYYRCSN